MHNSNENKSKRYIALTSTFTLTLDIQSVLKYGYDDQFNTDITYGSLVTFAKYEITLSVLSTIVVLDLANTFICFLKYKHSLVYTRVIFQRIQLHIQQQNDFSFSIAILSGDNPARKTFSRCAPYGKCYSAVSTNAKCYSAVSTNAKCYSAESTNAKCYSAVSTNAKCYSAVSTNAKCYSAESTNAKCYSAESTNAKCYSAESTNAKADKM